MDLPYTLDVYLRPIYYGNKKIKVSIENYVKKINEKIIHHIGFVVGWVFNPIYCDRVSTSVFRIYVQNR